MNEDTKGDRRIEVYEDKGGRWRWRVVADRGNLPDEVIADSGQGYTTRTSARRAARSLFRESIRITFPGEGGEDQ